ncbi:hypothetical protein, partial [Ralstonia pseudosolanacearum]|uniref:hypothetical protein n=1 Tax=Ralstonia pseudosolanacearum TaxID=1310165 RepID=UPI003D171FF0
RFDKVFNALTRLRALSVRIEVVAGARHARPAARRRPAPPSRQRRRIGGNRAGRPDQGGRCA